ncbi:MAG: capsule biosynthesis protein CapK [Verrucomicrobiae bacterium]|nr:capsule biosynthesis protein CapK [Verrucomicrobiae bacterium]
MDEGIGVIAEDDRDRFPILGDEGGKMLRFLREHAHAPLYRNRSGHRLGAEDIRSVKEFMPRAMGDPVEIGRLPDWLSVFLETSHRTVPFYRRYGALPKGLTDWPLIGRSDVAADPALFVRDHVPVARLIHYRTSGTTGHPLSVPSHPRVAACYLAFHLRALKRLGMTLRHGAGQVGVVILGCQKKCFTYVSVTPLQGESGLAKINLHPDDWRHPDDRVKYLEALNAEVVAGDPLSFVELLRLDPNIFPRVIFSTAMALEGGMRKQLEERYQCPVLDFYSLNEAGPVAVYDADLGGHVLLQPRLHVEILGENQQPLSLGQRGEITLTGGFNFCLPLVRYRTGDQASLEWRRGEPVLIGLQGRPPVRFFGSGGHRINNVDVTHVLQSLGLVQFTLHQAEDRSLAFKGVAISGREGEIQAALKGLFGEDQTIHVFPMERFEGKVIQYTSSMKTMD